MSDPNLVNYIAIAAISCGAGVSGRILFDWLKNRSGSQVSTKNKPDAFHVLNASECFKWKTGVDSCLATHENTLETHEKRLDKGSVDFDGIKQSIAGIDKSMAVFAEKLKKG